MLFYNENMYLPIHYSHPVNFSFVYSSNFQWICFVAFYNVCFLWHMYSRYSLNDLPIPEQRITLMQVLTFSNFHFIEFDMQQTLGH